MFSNKQTYELNFTFVLYSTINKKSFDDHHSITHQIFHKIFSISQIITLTISLNHFIITKVVKAFDALISILPPWRNYSTTIARKKQTTKSSRKLPASKVEQPACSSSATNSCPSVHAHCATRTKRKHSSLSHSHSRAPVHRIINLLRVQVYSWAQGLFGASALISRKWEWRFVCWCCLWVSVGQRDMLYR